MRVFNGQSQRGMQQEQMGHQGAEGKGHGPQRPPLEDQSQTVITNDDGSVEITLAGTDPDGEVHTNTVTLSDSAEGGISIHSLNDQGREKSVTISEDSDDGGVDIDISCINEEGETVSRHIELDLNDDGTLSFTSLSVRDGEEQVREHTLELAQFLGEEGEALNVAEVFEASMARGPIDLTDVDLSGLNSLASELDLLLV